MPYKFIMACPGVHYTVLSGLYVGDPIAERNFSNKLGGTLNLCTSDT